ncbi:MAG: hypothetical protein WCI62_01705 [Erysipelotrichaceae bacterium]
MTAILKYIDRRLKTPFSQQIFQSFKNDILVGRYLVSERLPSSENLASTLSIPLKDCENAYDLLIKAKLIEFKNGNYYSLLQPIPAILLEKKSDFRMIITSRNMEYSVIDEAVSPLVYDENVHPKEFSYQKAVVLRRRFYGDRQCLICSINVFSANDLPSMVNKTKEDTRPFSEFFKQDNISNYKSKTIIHHEKLPDDLADFMGQAHSASCSMSENFGYANNRLIDYTRVWILGEGFRFEFSTELQDL